MTFKTQVAGLMVTGHQQYVPLSFRDSPDFIDPPTLFQDASFACALTLDGWTTKPQCFKFLERKRLHHNHVSPASSHTIHRVASLQ